MSIYYLKCRKKTESKNPRFAKTTKGKPMLISICAKYDSKKLRFMKEREASGLLTSLRIKTHLSKIPLVGPLLF